MAKQNNTIAKELGYIENIENTENLLKQVNALLLGFKKHLDKSTS